MSEPSAPKKAIVPSEMPSDRLTAHTPSAADEMSTIARAWVDVIRARRAYHAALDRLREALVGGPRHD